MKQPVPQKEVVWISSSKKDVRGFPDEVKDTVGFALFQAQLGQKHPSAKPMRGFKGGGVLEVVEDFDGDTYRAVYTVKFKGYLYVLHAFQKKSKKGIKTPATDLAVIKTRLKSAEDDFNARTRRSKNDKSTKK